LVRPQTVHVNDVDLAYVEQGDGNAVVFVHGGVNDYRSWRGQLAPVAERYRSVTYSRRYHWPNPRPGAGDGLSTAQHTSDLGALIAALGLAPAHLVGSSCGALTALTVAVERPDLVRALDLGEPPLLPWLTRLLDTFLATARRPAGQAFARGEAEVGVRTFIDGEIGPGAFHLPLMARSMMLDNAGVERLETVTPPEQYFPALSPDDVTRLAMPVLVVEGERSTRMFGLIIDELARAPDGRTDHHPGCVSRHAWPEPTGPRRRAARLLSQAARDGGGTTIPRMMPTPDPGVSRPKTTVSKTTPPACGRAHRRRAAASRKPSRNQRRGSCRSAVAQPTCRPGRGEGSHAGGSVGDGLRVVSR
jgi:pimeloyl-ACP methyl ester carboxylesterase